MLKCFAWDYFIIIFIQQKEKLKSMNTENIAISRPLALHQWIEPNRIQSNQLFAAYNEPKNKPKLHLWVLHRSVLKNQSAVRWHVLVRQIVLTLIAFLKGNPMNSIVAMCNGKRYDVVNSNHIGSFIFQLVIGLKEHAYTICPHTKHVANSK